MASTIPKAGLGASGGLSSMKRAAEKAAAEKAAADKAAADKAAAEKAAAEKAAAEPEKAAVSPETQAASRQRHAADVPLHLQNLATPAESGAVQAFAQPESVQTGSATNDVDPGTGLTAEQQREVDGAVGEIDAAAEGVTQSAGDQRAQGAATLEATATVESALEGKDPAVQRAILEQTEASLEVIGEGMAALSPEETDAAVGQLSRAAEAVGQDHVAGLTDPVAKGVQRAVQGYDGGNFAGELASSLEQNIKQGNGALFGAALTKSTVDLERARPADAPPDFSTGVLPLSYHLGRATEDGIAHVREQFSGSADAVDQVNYETARAIQDTEGFGLSEEQVEGGIEAIRERNGDKFDAYDDDAALLASTLEGASYARGLGADYPELGSLSSEGTRAIEQVERLGQSEQGLEALADTVERQGEGRRTFLDGLEGVASQVDDAKGFLDNVSTMVLKGGAMRVARHLEAGDTDAAARFFRGLESNDGIFRTDRRTLGQFSEAFGEFRAGRLSPEDLSASFSNTANRMQTSTGNAPDSRVAAGFKLLGVAVGGASLARDLGGWDELQSSDRMRAIVDAADLSVDATEGVLGAFGKSAPRWLKVGGAFTGALGAAFDTVDAVTAFQNGDVPRGAASATSALGGLVVAGAVLASSGVGAVVGAGLIAVGTIGNLFLGRQRSKDAERAAEENFESFLGGAGFSPEQAHRLRDLDGDHRSVFPALRDLAPHAGMTPEELLGYITDPANVSDGDLKHLVNYMEGLPKNEQGGIAGDAYTLDWALQDLRSVGWLPPN